MVKEKPALKFMSVGPECGYIIHFTNRKLPSSSSGVISVQW